VIPIHPGLGAGVRAIAFSSYLRINTLLSLLEQRLVWAVSPFQFGLRPMVLLD